MRKGTRLNLRCKRCGRAYKNAGSLAKHTSYHRESDALYRKQLRKQQENTGRA